MPKTRTIDKGWPGTKLYLSHEAIALLKEHCTGTPLTMSAYVDMLIKRDLDSPAERFLRENTLKPLPLDTASATANKLIEEGRRQITELVRMPEEMLRSERDSAAKTEAASKKDFKVDI